MDAYGPTIARIRYLTNQGPYQATPKTITATIGGATIYSYGMVIAERNWDGTYTVAEEADAIKSDGTKSLTTRRHIRCAKMALNG